MALGLSKVGQAVFALLALKATLRIMGEEDYSRYVAFLLVSNFAIAFMGWPAYSVLRLGTEEWQSKRKLARTFLHAVLVMGSFALLAGPAHEAKEEIDVDISVPGATTLVLGYALVTALGSVLAALLKPAGRVVQFVFPPRPGPRQVTALAAFWYSAATSTRARSCSSAPRPLSQLCLSGSSSSRAPSSEAPRRRRREGRRLRPPRPRAAVRPRRLRVRQLRDDQALPRLDRRRPLLRLGHDRRADGAPRRRPRGPHGP